MEKTVFLILTLFVATLVSCDKVHLGEDWSEGIVYFTGEPELDGCGWLLLHGGNSYHVPDLAEEFMLDGTEVWFKGQESSEAYKCGLQADQYKLYDVSEMRLKPWLARELDQYPDYQPSIDHFSMDSVYVDGDSLRMHVGYSGGCAPHQFNLWILENEDGSPHLMLEHISNGDPCEAYPQEWLAFSLERLRQRGKNEVSFLLRGSPMMSVLYGPYTYKY